MIVISTREFRANQNKYLGMAADGEDIVLKSRGWGNFKIVPVSTNDALARIPKEYRCDPYAISPSGDLFWADKRNVEELTRRLQDIENGNAKISVTLENEDDIRKFLNSI